MRISFLTVLSALIALMSGCGGNSRGEFEYVAIGASDAAGFGATPRDNGYVFLIQQDLERRGYDVGLLNLGIPGAETDEMQNLELPIAIEQEPELVTVFAGPNDIVSGISEADFRNDIGEILSSLTSRTAAAVFVATIPDLTQLPRFRSEPNENVTSTRVASFNNIIREEAARAGAHVVELSRQSVDAVEVSDDGFHPNDRGHETIANAFLASITMTFPGQ
jgi:acyl-CoA thioesterase I